MEMYALVLVQKTREYLDYVERHIKNVNKAWEVVQEKCADMWFVSETHWRSLLESEIAQHDVSKLSQRELVPYRQKFNPSYFEPFIGDEFGEAWRHHLLHNDHHWQNWTKQEFIMPPVAKLKCVHMIIDWEAMGYEFGNNAQEYYEENAEKIDIPENMVEFMYEIFERLYS